MPNVNIYFIIKYHVAVGLTILGYVKYKGNVCRSKEQTERTYPTDTMTMKTDQWNKDEFD